MDETRRENFRNGVDGAEHLSEAELMQIDESYILVSSTREDNPRYSEKIDQAIILLLTYLLMQWQVSSYVSWIKCHYYYLLIHTLSS